MKIVVCGPFQCGKSEYINALDNNAINISTIDKNKNKITIGMDIGNIKIDGVKISLFGTPGLLRFKTIRQIIVQGADGIIFIFDGLNSNMDDSAIQILNEIRMIISREIPIVFCVNKCDDNNCRDIKSVREQNYIPELFPMYLISAKNKINVKDSLMKLISLIKENLSPLLLILKECENDLTILNTKLNMNPNELNNFLYSMEIRGLISIDRENKTFKLNSAASFFT